MIDEGLIIFRWISHSSLLLVIGSSFFWWFCGNELREKIVDFNSIYARISVASSITFILSQAFVVVFHYLSIGNALGIEDITFCGGVKSFIENTRSGKVEAARILVCLVILVVSLKALKNTRNSAMHYCVTVIFAGGVLIVLVGSFSGHFAGRSDTLIWMFVQGSHLLAIAVWAGGLPLWLFVVKSKYRKNQIDYETIEFVRYFSMIAMMSVAVIALTGIIMSSEFVFSEGDLVGTPWGRWLMIKLSLAAIVLFLGNGVRRMLWEWQTNSRLRAVVKSARYVSLELLVVVLVLFAASFMGATTPAIHDRAFWPLSFRMSFEQAWSDSILRLTILAGCFGVAVNCLLLFATRKRVNVIRKSMMLLLVFLSVGCVLWAAAIPANPDTFRRSEVPYLVDSIANGMKIFRKNCVACHGRGGRGNGEFANKMAVPPADLTAPHTALHTAGDMFWWIRNGIPKSNMPGFSNDLTELEAWDVVNFLRTFSQGFQARLITSRIVFEKPWLGAPDFYFYDRDENVKQLKSMRGSYYVLIVAAKSYFDVKQRIKAIAEWNEDQNNEKILVIVAAKKDDAPIVSNQFATALSAGDVYKSYSLLARTLTFRGDSNDVGVSPEHAEFLIDKNGYIRARWVEEDDDSGWQNIKILEEEIYKLTDERFVPKPPDEHIH